MVSPDPVPRALRSALCHCPDTQHAATRLPASAVTRPPAGHYDVGEIKSVKSMASQKSILMNI
jgi:hypothetical protein